MSDTYDPEIDGERLGRQADLVRKFMVGTYPRWSSLSEIESGVYTHPPQASVSARLRDLRNRHGFTVERQRRKPGGGTWEYRVRPKGVLGDLF